MNEKQFIWNDRTDGASLKEKLQSFVYGWNSGQISNELLAEILLSVIVTIEENSSDNT